MDKQDAGVNAADAGKVGNEQSKPTILFIATIQRGYSSFTGDYSLKRSFDFIPHKHAILALVAWLRENGCEGHYVWGYTDDAGFHAKIENAIASFKPDAIGFSLCTDEIIFNYSIIELIKKSRPDLPVIVGGPHPSALPEHTLRHFPLIDYIVIGEGENTLTEWLKLISSGATKADMRTVKGLAFSDDNAEIVITPKREQLEDINILPDPAYDLIYDPDAPRDQRRAFPLVCSYGCRYFCTFCAAPHGDFRYIDPVRIVERMQTAMDKYGVDYFAMLDSLWPPSIEWMDAFCDEVEKRGMKISFQFLTRAGQLTEEHLRRLKRLGAKVIGIGVEAGDPEVLKRVRKGITPDMARRSFIALNKVGIFTAQFFIFGNQGETRETINSSIALARELNGTMAVFRALAPLPGSVVFNEVGEDIKDWWMAGSSEKDWWVKGVSPSICELEPEELERLTNDTFIRYPLRFAYIRQHILGRSLPGEYRKIALSIFLVQLRKYLLGMSERFWLTRRVIRSLKSIRNHGQG